ncbi:MAG: primosomal protein N' [Patiriisocius sp.]|jgi:primosomal protein N'
MFIIEVIPLARAGMIDSLSYYSATQYSEGSLITVPIRKKVIQGVVVSAKPVSAAKTAIRAATFSLKKLATQENPPSLPKSLMQTAQELAKVTPAHLGGILFALLPPDVRTGMREYPYTTDYENNENYTPSILSALSVDRFISYRSHIRQCFAHRGSVLFVVPTSASVHSAKEALENGIEKRVVTFASTHTKKQIEKSYEAFSDLSTAKLIITTPNFAFLDRHDITSIIVEECGSNHYKTRTRPYLDAREILKTYARVTKRNILFGDILPRTEEEALRRDDVYETYEEHPKRLGIESAFTVSEHEKTEGSKEFEIFTPQVIDSINRTIKAKGKVFLFAARKGLAPLVTCWDCSHIFRCPDSGAPYSLLQTYENGEEKRWFFSSTSGKKVRADDTCPKCGSWRLREQGIGIQQVAQQVRKHFADAPLTIFDHTSATTHVKAKKLAKQFYETKGSIMIGTTMALPYLTKPVAVSVVTSYEAARAIPTWRAEETLLGLLLSLREKTSNECFVQTRTETDQLLKYAARGLVDDFYSEEIMMRKALSYPPYAVFILLTWAGTPDQIREAEEYIKTQTLNHDMQCYNAPTVTKKGITRYGLIRIPKEEYPDAKLVEQLRQLPPSVKIEINPDKII